MIIHSITLQNFGIYAGAHTFDLAPRSDGRAAPFAVAPNLLRAVRQHDRELGRLEAELERLPAEEKRLTYHIERLTAGARRVAGQMAAISTDEGRIKLAARNKLLLDTYQQRLIRQKLAQLAAQRCRDGRCP
jgi:DNA repair exonuclease SbcCD ATPase subunit